MDCVSVLLRLAGAGLIVAAVAYGAARAQPITLERRIEHPGGVSLVLRTIEPRADSVVLSATIANPTDHAIRLNRARSFVIEEVDRAIHFLNPPADNPELLISARADVAAVLVFIGPLAPSTRQLTLTANRGGGTPDNPHDDTPALRATVPIPPSTGGIAEVQAGHPNGAAVRIRRATAGPTGCAVALRATNGNDRTIQLNHDSSLALVDARAVAAQVSPPPDNPELAVPPGQRLDADLVFDCRGIDTTGALTLSTNRGTAGTPDNPYDMLPVIALRLPPERGGDAPWLPSASRATLAPIARSRLATSTIAAAPTASADTPAAPASGPTPPSASAPAPEAVPATKPERPAASPSRPAGPAPAAPRPPMTVPQLEAALRVSKSDRGTRVMLPADALFGSDGDTIQAAAEPLLAQLIELIAKSRPREVVVAGHTDSAGSDDENLALSEKRARAITAWLLGRASKRRPQIVEKAFGRTRPLAPNHHPDGSANPDGRERNRRIEVMLLR